MYNLFLVTLESVLGQPHPPSRLPPPPPQTNCSGPVHECIVPDWLRALTLGKLPALVAAAAGPVLPSGWGLAGCLLRPCLLLPTDLSCMKPVCTGKLQVIADKVRLFV